MKSDDFYYNYLNKASLSSSMIKKLSQSPKSYEEALKKSIKPTSALIEGRLFHQAILEPHLFEKYIFLNCELKTSKIYKDAIKENPDQKHLYYTKKEFNRVNRLVDAFLQNNSATSLLKNAEFEVPQINLINKIPFRGKADILNGNEIYDLKTTLSIKSWKKENKKWSTSPYNYDYDVQAFIYCTLFNIDYKNFYFLVIDKITTDIGIFEISEEFYLSGKRKTYSAINVFKEFILEDIDLNSYTIRGIL